MQEGWGLAAAVGRAAIVTTECVAESDVLRIAALLDLDSSEMAEIATLPRGWHFCALGAATPRSVLRPDGYPGLGVPMPDLGLPRLLQAGREVHFYDDIGIGDVFSRTSSLADVRQKGEGETTRAIVTVRHELMRPAAVAPFLVEEQTFVLMPPSRYAHREQVAVPVEGDVLRTVVPDATMLFQYSALGFNSHKIHLDRQFATEVEGFPDLVVNGGLVTLLVTEFLRRDLRITPKRLKIANRAPLFCDRPVTLAASLVGERWQVKVHDHRGQVAADAELEIQ